MDYYRNREVIKPSKSKHTSDNCVCDVVKKIIKAQNEVIEDCSTSCEHSIRELQGKGNRIGPLNTTIPFILYCKGNCEAFIGSGVFKSSADKYKDGFFGCVETPIFRAKSFVKDSDCCVKLELLLPASDECEIKFFQNDNYDKVCSFFSEDDPVTNFIATGICLTVDLDQFLGITCLDPITPM